MWYVLPIKPVGNVNNLPKSKGTGLETALKNKNELVYMC